MSAREKVHDNLWWKLGVLTTETVGIIVQSVAWPTCNVTGGFFIWCDAVNLVSQAEWPGGKAEKSAFQKLQLENV